MASTDGWVRGARCVCVDASPGTHPDSVGTPPLVRRAVYEVYDTDECDGVAAVQVTGHGISGAEYAARGYWLRRSRFRLLVHRTSEEDAALFAPLLGTSPEERLDLLAADLDALAKEGSS